MIKNLSKNKIIWCFSSLFFILNCSSLQKTAEFSLEQKRYQNINRLFLDGNYPEAQRQFREFLGTHPGSPWSDDAQYRIAYSYVSSANAFRDYDQAADEFRKVIEDHPGSQYERESQNWIAAIEELKKCQQTLRKEQSEQKSMENSITILKKERQDLTQDIQRLKAEKDQLENALENLQNILHRIQKK